VGMQILGEAEETFTITIWGIGPPHIHKTVHNEQPPIRRSCRTLGLGVGPLTHPGVRATNIDQIRIVD